MSVNVKTATGLKKISGENITSSKIISALGFTPAQAAAVEKYVAELRAAIDAKTEFSGDYNDLINAPAIVDDQSSALYITDSQGNIIMEVNEDGIYTTDVFLQEKSVLDAIGKVDNIVEDNSDAFLITDSQGNIIFKTDSNGVETTAITVGNTKINSDGLEIDSEKFQILDATGKIAFQVDNTSTQAGILYAGGVNVNETLNNLEQGLEDLEKITIPEILEDYYTTEETDALLSANETQSTNYTNDAITAIKGTVSTDYDTLEKIESKVKAKAESSVVETLSDTVDDHIKDNIRHITADERSRWEAKSDFDGDYNSLENRPVVEDESGIFIVADESGNIALQIDSEATRIDNLIVNTISTSGSANNDLIIEGTVYIDNSSSEPKEVATKEYVDTELADLVNSAPETLDTLGELAKAFEENDSVVSALETAIVNKLEISDFNKHKNNENTEKHVTTDQINAWNAYETTKAKTNHAASDTTYGSGSNSLYGHVKLSDSTTGTETVNSGVAATPKAVADTHALATAVNTALEAEVSRATEKENELNILLTSTNELASTTANTLSGHIDDNVRHVTQTEKDYWNEKSDFSGEYSDLENAPLVEDESGILTIVDEDGYIAMQIDNTGTYFKNLYVDGEDITSPATQEKNGLMDKEDKIKLDNITPLYVGDDELGNSISINADTLNGYTADEIIAAAGGSGGGAGTIDYQSAAISGSSVVSLKDTTSGAGLYPRTSIAAVEGLSDKLTQLENSSGGGTVAANAVTFVVSDTEPTGAIGKIWFDTSHPTTNRHYIKIWNGVSWEVVNSWQ